jgi:ATP-dependent phosphoenolpyruvate carboxykinase
MKIEYTWRIVDGSLLEAEYELTPIFNLAVPTEVKRVPTELLHPENSVSKVLTLFSKSMKMQLDVDLHWVL